MKRLENTLSQYCYVDSDRHYGTHAMAVRFGRLTVFYSYQTPIAFSMEGQSFVRENDWGPTTNGHMYKAVPGHSREDRLNGDEFLRMLHKAIQAVVAELFAANAELY